MIKHFSKEDIQLANKHTKRYSIALVTRETQTQTTKKYHFTPIRIAIIMRGKKTHIDNNKC